MNHYFDDLEPVHCMYNSNGYLPDLQPFMSRSNLLKVKLVNMKIMCMIWAFWDGIFNLFCLKNIMWNTCQGSLQFVWDFKVCVCVSVCKSMQVLTRVGIINKVILINIDTYVCYTIHAVPWIYEPLKKKDSKIIRRPSW